MCVQRQGRRTAVAGRRTSPRASRRSTITRSRSRSRSPTRTFLRRIAGAVYYILPEHILGDLTGAKQALTCEFCLGTAGVTIGSGPYDFTDVDLGHRRELHAPRRTTGRARTSQIEQIVYKIQESNVSVAPAGRGRARPASSASRRPRAPASRASPGLKQLNVPGVGIFAINFNNSNTDKAFRQAIAYAINRPEIIEQVLGGLATLNYTIPPGFTVYDGHQQVRVRPGQGQGAARRRPSGTSARPSAWLYLAEDPNFTVTAPALQQYIEALGLKVELTALPTAPYIGPHPEDATTSRSSCRSVAARASAGTSRRSTTTARAWARRQLKLSRGPRRVHLHRRSSRRPRP